MRDAEDGEYYDDFVTGDYYGTITPGTIKS